MKQVGRILSANLAVLFVVMTILAGIPTKAGAAVLSDINGHWAQSYVLSGVNRGYISGYTDGTFRPNNPVSRAEFTKMINQAIGLSRLTNISFTDVGSGSWYYNSVRQGVAAGYISGYSDGTFRADSNISRQEAAVILSRIITPATNLQSISGLADYKKISDWAVDSVRTVFSKGYIAGDPNKNFNPGGNLTRGEAAKLIEMILMGETIVSGNQIITVDNYTAQGTIYTGTVTIAGNVTGTTNFSGCKILGLLQVDGGGTTVLNNSGVVSMNVAVQTTVSAIGSSSIKETVVSKGCTLQEPNSNSGDGFIDVKLEGATLVDDTVNLSGKFGTVTVNNRCNLNLTSGTIEKLIVNAGAAGSNIDLSQSTRVVNLEVNGTAAFTGLGNITLANPKAPGVTFQTAPDNMATLPPTGVLVPEVSPANGTMNVPTTTAITLTFRENIYTGAREPLTPTYIQNSVIELHKGSETGPTVAFTGSISGTYRIITIAPTIILEEGTTYYIVLKPGLTNPSGQMNSRQVFSFSTSGGSLSTWANPASIPAQQATGVASTTNITLTFPEPVFNTSNGLLTPAYLQGNVIQVREGSAQGNLVSFVASIDGTNKVISITPATQLKQNTRYYVDVMPNTLQTAQGVKNANAYSIWFTCGLDQSVLVPVFTPANGAVSVSDTTTITARFDQPLYNINGLPLTADSSGSTYLTNQVFELRKGNATSGEKVSFTAALAADRQTVTLTPISPLTRSAVYWIVLKDSSLATSTGLRNSLQQSSFTVYDTGSVIGDGYDLLPQPIVNPRGSSVPISSGITIQFSEAMYTKDEKLLTSAYLTGLEGSFKRVSLQKGQSTTEEVPFTATISPDCKTITLIPAGGLQPNTTYSIHILQGALMGSSRDRNPVVAHSFKTSSAGMTVNTIVKSATTATTYVHFDTPGSFTMTINGPGMSNTVLLNGYTPPSNQNQFSANINGLTAGGTYTVTVTQHYGNGSTLVATDSFIARALATDSTLANIQVRDDTANPRYINIGAATTYTVSGLTAVNGQVELTFMTNDARGTISVNAGIPELNTAASGSSCKVNVQRGATTTIIILGGAEDPHALGTMYTLNLQVNP